jgi:hypothetical protein
MESHDCALHHVCQALSGSGFSVAVSMNDERKRCHHGLAFRTEGRVKQGLARFDLISSPEARFSVRFASAAQAKPH